MINGIGPNFTGRNAYIFGNKGVNKENPFLFNKVRDIMRDFQATVIYNTGKNEINFPDAPNKLIEKLLDANILVFDKQGEKFKRLI